jgi:hypothetical protein
MKKIIDKIILFFKYIILALISPFRKDKKEEIKKDDLKNIEIKKESSKEVVTTIPTSLPDTSNINANPHDATTSTDEEAPQTVNLTIPKNIINFEKINLNDLNKIIFTKELIEQLIDEELEETYKDLDFKVKKATKKQEEFIKELKEKIVPKIEETIERHKLTTVEEVKKEVKDIVKEEMELKPLFPPIEINIEPEVVKEEPKPQFVEPPKVEEEIKKEPYTLATKVDKPLKLNEEKPPKINKEEKIAVAPNKPEIKEKITKTTVVMVPLVKEVPRPTIKQDLKEIALGTVLTTASVAKEIIKPIEKKEDVKQEPKKETHPYEPLPLEIPKLKEDLPKEITKEETKQPEEKTELTIAKEIQEEKIETHDLIEEKIKEFEYVDDHKDEVKDDRRAQINEERLTIEKEKVSNEIKKKDEEIEQLKEEKQEKEEQLEAPKPLEKAPDFIANEISSVVRNSNTEMDSDKEFEDKEYDYYEDEINSLLSSIAAYKNKYEKRLTNEQRTKLKEQEQKLEAAKNNITERKTLDIEKERKAIEEEIAPSELEGLQLEVKKKHIENKMDLSEEQINKVEDLEHEVDSKVQRLEKKVIKKKIRKALIATQLGSILALPFIKNKYFFYFTAGIIARTELMFLGDLFRRKTTEYEPIDLSSLKTGRDALNGALDVTENNLLYLDNLEQTAFKKYPELSGDFEYIQQVTSLRVSLTKMQKKLTRKKESVDKHISKIVNKDKKLKKILQPKKEVNNN